ncbi:metalloendoproteinase 1-like [Benincasa hispida]|uniref:metalloendoproteinase 1-like n=1 Tax=Benincasa hispida TaxID=102211 RepID=UPI001901FB5F|nr:metalloendoproteinase 1-like [Benincasa hispida]
MAFKSLQLLFLFLTTTAPHVISKQNSISFPQHLHGCRKGDNVKGIHNIKTYLQHYGYLLHNTSTDFHTNKLKNDIFNDALESAIKSYQKRFNLNMSGVLDEETLVQISRPRCGVPDFSMSNPNKNPKDDLKMSSHYTFFPNNPKWPNTKFHLTYTFTNNYPLNLVPSVTEAMATWALNSQFTFSEVVDGQIADINISFQRGEHGDGNPFDGPGGMFDHASAPTDGRLHFDGDESWSAGVVDNELNVMTVALHELGHVLGLGHSSIQQAIMWPYMNPGTIKGLNDDDIVGLRALYG